MQQSQALGAGQKSAGPKPLWASRLMRNFHGNLLSRSSLGPADLLSMGETHAKQLARHCEVRLSVLPENWPAQQCHGAGASAPIFRIHLEVAYHQRLRACLSGKQQDAYPAILLLIVSMAANLTAFGSLPAARFAAIASRYPGKSSGRIPTASHYWSSCTLEYHAVLTKSSLRASTCWRSLLIALPKSRYELHSTPNARNRQMLRELHSEIAALFKTRLFWRPPYE